MKTSRVIRCTFAVLLAGVTGFGVTRSTAGAVAWSPLSLAGLKLWLDASDGATLSTSGSAVTQWRDKSGNGFHAAPPSAGYAPTVSGGAVNFLSNQYLLGSMPAGTLSGSVQVTVVFKTCSCGLAGYQAMPFNRTMNNFPTPFDGYESSLLVGGPTGSYSGWSGFTDLRNNTNLMVLSTSMSATKVAQYRNGSLVQQQTGSFPYQDVPNAYHIATRYDRVTQFRGDVYEVVVTNELSAADRTDLEQYLANKWTVSGMPTTTTTSTSTTTSTTTTSTTTTTTTIAPTTTVRPATTTVAPALEIVVNAPTSSAAPPVVTTPTTGEPVQPVNTVAPAQVRNVASPAPTTTVPPATTTTTTIAKNAGGTVAPPVPRIEVVQPGEAAVSVGGKSEAVTVERADNQVTVRAGALSATLGSIDKNGAVGALDNDGNVRLKAGDTVRIKLAGFEPGSPVEAWLFSTPTLMGTAKVAEDGTVTGNFVIPTDAPAGAHRIAIVAKTKDGQPATLTVGVRVGDWKKESSITVWLIVMPIVLAVFGALTLPATRRRRNRAR